MTIDELDIDDLRVEAYQGTPDDAPGTEIQDGRNPQALALARTITADQKAEIAEMTKLLQAL